MLRKAYNLAKEYHEGQTDKVGRPTFEHACRVTNITEEICDNLDFDWHDKSTCLMSAMLHDIVEDTEITIDKLKEIGFPDEVVAAIDSLTRRDGESYGDYVKRASENKYAIIVKKADLIDHLDIKHFKKLKGRDFDRLNKYLKWYHFIEEKLKNSIYG